MRILTIIILSMTTTLAFAQQAFYDVTANSGNGIRFWGGNDGFKISMGIGSGYSYGPVQSFSIRSTMDTYELTRGWTWGLAGSATNVAALDVQGNMQIASTFTSNKIGIGTPSPDAKLHVITNSANTNRSSPQASDISTILHNTNSTDNNFTSLVFADAYGWGVASVVGQVKSHSAHTGILSFLTRKNGGSPTTQMLIDENGNVGIGSSSPSQKLTVNGTIYGKEVKVDLSVPGPDYVFEESYSLPTLEEVKSFIAQNKHLPEVPSAKEMEENGIMLGEMNILLLKKVEELTLYMIEQRIQIEKMQLEINQLKK